MFDPNALKQQLSPLVEPAPISLWPPAPGWFILAALLLIVVIWGIWRWQASRKRNRYRRYAQRELQQLWEQYGRNKNSPEFIDASNALLKRITYRVYHSHPIAELYGKEWIDFLLQHCKKKTIDVPSILLGDQRYQPDFNEDPTPLYTFARHWIKHHDA